MLLPIVSFEICAKARSRAAAKSRCVPSWCSVMASRCSSGRMPPPRRCGSGRWRCLGGLVYWRQAAAARTPHDGLCAGRRRARPGIAAAPVPPPARRWPCAARLAHERRARPRPAAAATALQAHLGVVAAGAAGLGGARRQDEGSRNHGDSMPCLRWTGPPSVKDPPVRRLGITTLRPLAIGTPVCAPACAWLCNPHTYNLPAHHGKP